MNYRCFRKVLALLSVLLLISLQAPSVLRAAGEAVTASPVPVLVYHRFGPVAADSMTVTTALFESHLRFFKENGYTVIPLRRYIDYRLGRASAPPPRSVVITVDDGHRSVYTEMLPLVKKYRIPVTLFIYPSAISNASYAMKWENLRELEKTGLFEVQSHTYWHPNFKTEKKRLGSQEYQRFLDMQFKKSKEKLEKELGIKVDILAWPFGIHDDELMKRAHEAGYAAAFTIERRHAGAADVMMALPRYLMTNGDRGAVFAQIMARR